MRFSLKTTKTSYDVFLYVSKVPFPRTVPLGELRSNFFTFLSNFSYKLIKLYKKHCHMKTNSL